MLPIRTASQTRLITAYAFIPAGSRSSPGQYLPHGFVKSCAGLEQSYGVYDRLLNGLIGGGIPDKLYNKVRRGAALAGLIGKPQPGSMGAFARNATASHRDWIYANEARHRLRVDWQTLFENYDVVLLPSVCVPAIPHDHGGTVLSRKIDVDGQSRSYTNLFRWIAPPTLAGLPATSAPVGVTDDGGMPVGLQIVGNYGHDRTTIAFAQHLAATTEGFKTPPQFG